MTDDVFFAPLSELSARLRKRAFSAVELTRAFAERLERIGPRFNAVALALTEVALRRARATDDELKRERLRGPLQGLPFGAKDVLAFAGHPTAWGYKAYAAQVPDETATALQKLDQTGSVLIAKLSTVELAGRGPASLSGPALNPWDKTRWSGGGSAEAVAAGLVPFAIGSETSGSLINSSAYCGLTGLRPTYGLVSRHGLMPRAWSMDKVGALCRSAEDCGLVLQAIAGSDSQDPASVGKSFYYTPQYARKLTELKIGIPGNLSEPFASAAQAIVQSGIGRTSVTLPDFPWEALSQTIIGAESASIFDSLLESGQAPAEIREGADIRAQDYLKAQRVRSLVKRRFHEIFGDLDVVLAPVSNAPAPKLAETQTPADPWTLAGNLAGLPALSVPCGAQDNLPLGLQLIGPVFSENTLLAVAHDFQQRTDWHKRRPPAELIS